MYLFYTNPQNWTNAQAACQAAGGNLASMVDWYSYMTLLTTW
jgi:hypothetical protein